MKLYKALKLRKKLVGEVAKLKQQILSKNSYTVGAIDPAKYDVHKIYAELQAKIDELVGLKFVINEANREIQSKIYSLSELKALVVFWNQVPVQEGDHMVGYSDAKTVTYVSQIDEITRNQMVEEFQKKIDALQEDIDTYNYTTDIPWGDRNEDLPEVTEEVK
jgi:diadenosine tetraphosphate (Ap4A) HIT family hydrolase